MPSKSPQLNENSRDALLTLGEELRVRRQALGLTAVVVAEAANISRVTLHRIERGEPSVTMGAYMLVADALGMQLGVGESTTSKLSSDENILLPREIRLENFAVLSQIAWQTSVSEALSPREAFDFYERNKKYIDDADLSEAERRLVEDLNRVYGNEV